jgi:hypothetical protein
MPASRMVDRRRATTSNAADAAMNCADIPAGRAEPDPAGGRRPAWRAP